MDDIQASVSSTTASSLPRLYLVYDATDASTPLSTLLITKVILDDQPLPTRLDVSCRGFPLTSDSDTFTLPKGPAVHIVPTETQSKRDAIKLINRAISELSGRLDVHPERIMYALAGKVFSITSPPPFSGSKRHPGYLDFNGPSASDIIKWIVEKIFDRLEQGSINSSERKSKRTKKEVDVLEFVVKSFNEVVKETGKDWMDDLVLRGLTRTGHYLVQGRAIIPKYLRADGGVVGKKTTKKMMPVTPSRCSSEKRGREGGGQEESVARKKQKELLDSVGGQSKQIEASYLPSNSSASLVYHGYNYPGASRYPPQYIRFDAPLMHPPVPYGWPNGHHHSYSSYHYLPHTFHSLNLNSDNPLPPSPIPSSSPPLIKTELSLGHNPYVAPTSTSSSIYTSEIPLPTIQSLPPFPPKQTFSTPMPDHSEAWRREWWNGRVCATQEKQ